MSCSNQPNFACANGSDDTINQNWTFATGKAITFSNFGATFTASDTNPGCAAGEYKIFADTSDAKLKKCQDSQVSDLDTSGAASWSGLSNPTGTLSLSMDAAETTTFTWAGNTATANMFSFLDATGNTGTGHLVDIHTVGTSTVKPIVITAKGTTDGVEMSNTGALAKIGNGSISATDLACTGCVETTDIADNAVDGAKIAITSQATGDLMYYDGTDWVRLASAAGILKSSGAGQVPAYGGIAAADIGAGDLANVVVWNKAACTADPCTLPFTPRGDDTYQLVHHGIVLHRVTTCTGTGTNEYTGAGTAVNFCDTNQGINTGVDAVEALAEL